eukprot:10189303-Prorocentrum_lima.AAC.1
MQSLEAVWAQLEKLSSTWARSRLLVVPNQKIGGPPALKEAAAALTSWLPTLPGVVHFCQNGMSIVVQLQSDLLRFDTLQK